MEEIINVIELVINNIKVVCYFSGFVIGMLPYLDIDSKISWSVVPTLILFVFSSDEAAEFFHERVTSIILSYVFFVVLGIIVHSIL